MAKRLFNDNEIQAKLDELDDIRRRYAKHAVDKYGAASNPFGEIELPAEPIASNGINGNDLVDQQNYFRDVTAKSNFSNNGLKDLIEPPVTQRDFQGYTSFGVDIPNGAIAYATPSKSPDQTSYYDAAMDRAAYERSNPYTPDDAFKTSSSSGFKASLSGDGFISASGKKNPYIKASKMPTYRIPKVRGNAEPMEDDFGLEYEPSISKLEEKDDNSTYRVFLTKDRQTMLYGMCPKGYTGDTQDFINKINSGAKDFRQLSNIPNNKPIVKQKAGQGLLDGIRRARPAKVAGPGVSQEAFYKNTNHLMTFRNGSVYTGDVKPMGNATFQNTMMGNGTCAKNVPISGNDGNGGIIIGFTTGVFNPDNSTVEVIVCTPCPTRNPYGPLTYESKTYSKISVRYDHLNPFVNKFHADAYRVRVVTSEQSADLFGFKIAKRKMQDKTYTPDRFKVVRAYTCKKLDGQVVDIVEIKGDDGRFVKFLMSEVEFLTIDPDKVGVSAGKKTIKIGGTVRIVDDRKIKLEKNQQLIVSNIKKSTSGVKNSVVTLKDARGNTHNVLLKQIKAV